MKHKLTWGLVILLLAALVIFATGCPKTTGGGWFLNENECQDDELLASVSTAQSPDDGAKVTFGFTAQPTDDGAKGTFQLVDHSTTPPTRIHGTFESTPDGEWLWQSFSGKCTIVGTGYDPEELYDFTIEVWDLGEGANEFPDNGWLGDGISVFIDGELEYFGILGGGNIQVHWPKK